MISDVKNHPVSLLLDIDSKVVYDIPRYQREYTWNKYNWDAMFDDVLECNGPYFLGSIICVNQTKDPMDLHRLELVDGQQRMTTLSLLFLAIYSSLKEFKEDMDEDQFVELANLKNRLIIKKTKTTRITPQIQNNNLNDYLSLFSETEIIPGNIKPKNAGNRRVYKCFKFFRHRIEEALEKYDQKLDELLKLSKHFLETTLVVITVDSHADAYTLFESLNNRGVPLTPIDIIKNKLLSTVETDSPELVDSSFDQWQRLLENLGDDYGTQERFFRQYYNGFRPELKTIIEVPLATKSTLINIYEKLIQHDAQCFLKHIISVGEYMALILGQCENEELNAEFISCRDVFKSLERIQAAPSYLLLLNLISHREKFNLKARHFHFLVKQLVAFFVRRSITDLPPTYDLTRQFMSILEVIHGNATNLKGKECIDYICREIKRYSSDDELFRKRLSGPVYEENTWATRFILCSIEESYFNQETKRDLWRQDKKIYVWTIEHIFPQGRNIPEKWVNMIADGDPDKAKEVQEEHVHKLGNLTISGFNSALGNKSFVEKRDRKKDSLNVGYRNGLQLNEELKEKDTWQVADISKRTKLLVDKVVDLFKIEVDFQ